MRQQLLGKTANEGRAVAAVQHIFLADELHKRLPDARLFTFGSNQLYLRGEYNRSLRGMLVFSNNAQKFRLDAEVGESYKVTDISRATLPKDFERNPRIHQCFELESAK